MYLKFAGKRGESARDGGGFFRRHFAHGFAVAYLTSYLDVKLKLHNLTNHYKGSSSYRFRFLFLRK